MHVPGGGSALHGHRPDTQTAIGFLLTIVTIQATPLVAEHVGWPVAVALLALGPAAGTVAMLRLDRHMAPAPS